MMSKILRANLLGSLAVVSVWLIGAARVAQAGCGCNKPPPRPATVIPSVAFPGMPVTLYNRALKAGDLWTATFINGTTRLASSARVVTKRTITDPTGKTLIPQLPIVVPEGLRAGPVAIVARHGPSLYFLVPRTAFVVLGKPVAASETEGQTAVVAYSMAAGTDGTLYVGISGLASVCRAIEIAAWFPDYPLQFALGDIAIFNNQGYLIDTLTAAAANHVSISAVDDTSSYRLAYFRHSFEKYCHDHLPGGIKQVDPMDPNWHLDGTPHVDYATLFFAIAGRLPGNQSPAAGPVTADMNMESSFGSGSGTWEVEQQEEGTN